MIAGSFNTLLLLLNTDGPVRLPELLDEIMRVGYPPATNQVMVMRGAHNDSKYRIENVHDWKMAVCHFISCLVADQLAKGEDVERFDVPFFMMLQIPVLANVAVADRKRGMDDLRVLFNTSPLVMQAETDVAVRRFVETHKDVEEEVNEAFDNHGERDKDEIDEEWDPDYSDYEEWYEDEDEDEDEEEEAPTPPTPGAKRIYPGFVKGSRIPAEVIPPKKRRQQEDEDEEEEDEEPPRVDTTRADNGTSAPVIGSSRVLPAVENLAANPPAPSSAIVEKEKETDE